MGRYLKKFSTNNEYQNYINDKSKLILPNVSLVEGEAYCYFIPNQIGEPGEPTPEPEVVLTPTIHATFNATSENMVAFLETGNMKSLKIDGNQIDVGAPVPTQGSLNIAGNGITIDMGTGEAVVAPEYLVNTSEADFVSLKFTPTDKNISFDDYNAFALIIEIDGVVQAMPLPLEEIGALAMYMGMEYQSESHTVIVPNYFLNYMKTAGQISPTGLTGVFAKVNLEDGNIENFLDTTCNYYTVSGGLAGQYVFETEGTHEVEIELTDNSPTDMLFAMSCVSNIISMKNIKSIGPHTFTSCANLEEIAIPNGITEIHCMAIGNTIITEFTIPDSVTYIGPFTFYQCINLTSVTVGSGVTSIGDNAFNGCTSLASINIPDNVTKIGNNAFSECTSLTEITIPNSVTTIGDYAFNRCSNLASVGLGNGVTEIGDYVFHNCTSLTSVVIPDGVTSIGDYAFAYCSKLTSITIPDSVTSIGNNAFYGCSNLASVDLSNGVTSIGDYAFQSCYGLTEITIPNSVTTIGKDAFYGCSNLASVTVGSGVTSIGEGAFHSCEKLAEFNGKFATNDKLALILNDNLIAFARGSNVTTYTIPEGVTEIGDGAFRNCTSLTSVVIPDSVTTIGKWAFRDCQSLTEITIPDSVTTIGDSAFYNCSFSTITIPDGVTSIGEYAFASKVIRIDVYCKPTTPPSGDNYMFYRSGGALPNLYVPIASVDAYKAAQYWSDYSSVIEGYNF